MKKAVLLVAFTLLVPLAVKAVQASSFGPYSYFSHEVSVSYAQLKRDTWTWKFLNSSDTTTITYLAFTYTDKDGKHSDVCPIPLKPGASFGGGNAFTASSRPAIAIKTIKRTSK